MKKKVTKIFNPLHPILDFEFLEVPNFSSIHNRPRSTFAPLLFANTLQMPLKGLAQRVKVRGEKWQIGIKNAKEI